MQSGGPVCPDVRGHLNGLLLAVLEGGPLHGYAVIDRLRAQTSGAVVLEGGTLYPALRRLENSGLGSGTWTDAAGRGRRVYTLTPGGTAALHGERVAWREFVRTLGSLLDAPVTPRP